MDSPSPTRATVVGRYALYGEIAHGGMATVHVGRLLGPAGFARTVAIKRLHPNFAKDPEFVSMFMDEARLAARIHHPNVVSIIDVVATKGELLLVMDYVPGDSFGRLLAADRKQRTSTSPSIVVKIVLDLLFGLHAAHEARNERGNLLGIVHRDVSPQNVLVGSDGVGHVIDFGVAKAVGRVATTQEGQVKGKLAYMAPEQISSQPVDRRTDLYSVGAVLWEGLTGRRLFEGREVELMYKVLEGAIEPPSKYASEVSPELGQVAMRALDRDPAKRFPTALHMAEALERALGPASTMQVARWVARVGNLTLVERAQLVSEVESISEVSSVEFLGNPGQDGPQPPEPSAPVVSGLESPPADGQGSGSYRSRVSGIEPSTQTNSTVSNVGALGIRRRSGVWIAVAAGALTAAGAVFGVMRFMPKSEQAQSSGRPSASEAPASTASSATKAEVSAAAASAGPDANSQVQADAAAVASASSSAPAKSPGKAHAPGGPAPGSNDDTAKAKYGF
jgi:eukaryotic-like serine/threonine-protein kinase